MKNSRRSLFVIALAVHLAWAGLAQADLTLSDNYIFTANLSSGGVTEAGYYISIGLNISPSGSGTTATATQISGPGGTLCSFTLNAMPSTAYPNDYYAMLPYNYEYTGQWRIDATWTDGNQVQTAYTLTHVLDHMQQLPLAQSFSVSTSTGILTPMLSWTGYDSSQYPSGMYLTEGNNDYWLRARVRDASGIIYWDSPNFQTTYTSYMIPESANLQLNQHYILDLILINREVEGGIPRTENRAHNRLLYSTGGLYGDMAPLDGDVDGSDLVAWIAAGAPAGMVVSAFAANFGKTSGQ